MLQMLRRALLSLPFLRPRGSTNCDWNVQHSVFDLPELSGHIFQRNGYDVCPLDTYELWDFLTFFTGDEPGGPFDAPEGRVEGVNWGSNKVAINLGGGHEADRGAGAGTRTARVGGATGPRTTSCCSPASSCVQASQLVWTWSILLTPPRASSGRPVSRPPRSAQTPATC